jgi:PAS domain S-box-containing protein
MPQPHFEQVFQFIPNPSVLLLPDAPKFTIVAVNNAYLEAVNFSEKDLIGKGIFEAFPGNPEDKISNGVENLKNSLEQVISNKDSHKMPLQKHEIPIHGTTKFKAKYVNIQNIPIKDKNNNITHILHSIEDVTDKKNLELSLEIEKRRFQDLYFQAPLCMGILKGPNHVYELANPHHLELIGVKDVIGKTVKEVLPELEGKRILKFLDTVYETGETFSANEILVKFDQHGDGGLVDTYLNFNYQANRNNEGTIDGIFFFASDVTELIQARKKTEESENRYKELIQNSPIATYSCDLEGHILLYNKAAADLWGREPEIGIDNWCGSWKIYNEDGDPIPFDKCPMAIALNEGRKITDQEIIIERPNGDKLNIVPHPVPFLDSSGRVTGALNVLIDITSSKRAEKKAKESELHYQLLIEQANDAIFVADASEKFIEVNSSGCQLIGYTKEEFLRLSMKDLLFEEDLKVNSSRIENLKNGITIRNEQKIKRSDGTAIELEFSEKILEDGRVISIAHDISERKKAELNLIQSEKRLKESQEVANLGNWELNFETGISLWSNEACKIYGLSPLDNKQNYSTWLSFIHPEDMDAVLKIIDESNRTLSDTILNHRIILKDGTIKYIYGKSKFEFDNNQKPIGLYGITQDVTETTKAEKKVRFQSNLLNIISQATISANENGIINFWNKAATEIYGWTAEEALGKNVISLVSTEQKEGDIVEIMSELSKGNSSNEFLVKHKDGHTFSIFASTSPIYGKQGKFEGAIEVSLDITGRKKEEEELAKLNKELSDYKYALDESSIVAITDHKGTIKHVNDNFCKITQFSTEELIGQNHRIINSGYHSKEFFRNMWGIISGGKIWKGEVKNKAKDGSIYWVDTIITPFLDERGKPYQYVVTRFDITESKKAEENIKKQNVELVIQYQEKKNRAEELFIANKELAYQNGEKEKRATELILANIELDFQNGEKENRKAELFIANKELAYQNGEKEKRATELILANLELKFQNREKENRATELSLSNKELVKTNTELDRFVYSVSHDLRSPLTSILGLISFIEEDSREPDTLEQVKMIRESINRLDGFIKNILSYSQNNRTGLETVQIPIQKTIKEIVNSVRNIKEAKGILFQIDIDEQQPFYSDWQRFNTIMENLISNAIKYHTNEATGRYLNVTGTADSEELKLRISDNGIGIDALYHDKIFDMFYRLSSKTFGSGFGLYIVKETLEKMQGNIEVQSEKGVGSTFIITLKNLKE